MTADLRTDDGPDFATGEGGGPARAAMGTRSRHRRPPLHVVTVVVAVVGLAVTGVLIWLTVAANTHTEGRLLNGRVREAALVLTEIVPTIQTRLETVAATADVTDADVTKIGAYATQDLKSSKGGLFRSVSLWELEASGPRELHAWGPPPQLASQPSTLDAFLTSVQGPDELAVTSLLTRPRPAIAVAVVSIGAMPRFAVYAELPVTPRKRVKPPSTSVFADINYAIYLGKHAIGRDLLGATTTLPLRGRTERTVVPFGLSDLDFVAVATRPLAGGLLPALPWIIGFGGALLTLGAAAVSEWLIRRRQVAERLAVENQRLYAEQRSISQALQSALLPKQLPAFEGIALEARYVAGEAAADVGGDWYDVIYCDERSFIFAIGDVSGRGVPAATTMASLHYAIRAYAAQGDDAPTILRKLGSILDIGSDGHMATVLLGHVDVPQRQVELCNAGHLPPLVVSDGTAAYVETEPGAPIGVVSDASYKPVIVQVPPDGAVLVYTDGLVERRGEILDAGLERLRLTVLDANARARSLAGANARPGGNLVEAVVDRLLEECGTFDDVALLEMRWTS